nr:MAG TPA: hypothetical protein [Caudoviricetes sp.]
MGEPKPSPDMAHKTCDILILMNWFLLDCCPGVSTNSMQALCCKEHLLHKVSASN